MLPWTPSSLPNLIEIFIVRRCGGLILYCSRIRKNVTDRQRTENRQTDREFNYRGHSTAIPMEHRVERANTMKIYDHDLFWLLDYSKGKINYHKFSKQYWWCFLCSYRNLTYLFGIARMSMIDCSMPQIYIYSFVDIITRNVGEHIWTILYLLFL